ncbi:MAG: acyl-CoA thioesterase [Pedosphaera sp.]|nr:acyl-CoA thioesterase [Pedosphaera sp.]
MPSLTFRFGHRVTYGDCTVGNHVYYGRYLEILEAVRGEFFRDIGTSFLELQNQGALFPVVEVRLRYRGAAHYDDELTIELSVISAKRVRLDFGYRIVDATGNVLVEGETHHVCTSVNNELKRLPSELVALLKSYLPEPQSARPSRTDGALVPRFE